ncbi:MAG: general stress protein [Thermoguttaceae bacterium]
MSENNSVVAIFGTHNQAEDAVRDLQKDGFDMKKLSIVGRDYHTDEHVVGYYNAGDRVMYWGTLGAFWGGLWGILFGSAFFLVPGIGPLLVAGPLAMWIVGALEGAVVVGGLGALGAALVSIGIPEDSVLEYEANLKAGNFLLIVHATPQEVRRAKDCLDDTQATETTIHAEPFAVGA